MDRDPGWKGDVGGLSAENPESYPFTPGHGLPASLHGLFRKCKIMGCQPLLRMITSFRVSQPPEITHNTRKRRLVL